MATPAENQPAAIARPQKDVIIYTLVAFALVLGAFAAWSRSTVRAYHRHSTTQARVVQFGGLHQDFFLRTYACPRCSAPLAWGSAACARCGWNPRQNNVQSNSGTAMMVPVGGMGTAGGPLTPRQQNAAGMPFFEGHWLGLETIELDPQLAAKLGVVLPPGESGVLVDEVVLEAAESGIKAGDVVTSIGGMPTPNLDELLKATLGVKNQKQAVVVVIRKGKKMTFIMEARNIPVLGTAQMDAASPIIPGAVSPHRTFRNTSCTDCHIIKPVDAPLTLDQGDPLNLAAPVISKTAFSPHPERGRCFACHVVQ